MPYLRFVVYNNQYMHSLTVTQLGWDHVFLEDQVLIPLPISSLFHLKIYPFIKLGVSTQIFQTDCHSVHLQKNPNSWKIKQILRD